ncbi:MAG: SLC13 family permease [Planctomycetes bacterium]|nr:SLC13 family permease [Planctomycetota bacterium]NOG54868.1 SLC13 family permease [Planctomycetota bacterium]
MSNRIGPDVAMLGGLTVLMLLTGLFPGINIVDPPTGVSGFAERAVIMIGAIYIVAAGLQETGAIEMIAAAVLGRPKSLATAQLRMMAPVAVMSAFMNTTAVVAMYMPIVADWSRKMKISSSRLYMPLSFAAILGGTCTLIGTSSNVTIDGLYRSWLAHEDNETTRNAFGLVEPAFWWIAVVGVPSTIVGIGYVLLCSRWLLAERRPATQVTLEDRKYKVEMLVEPGSPIIGKTIEDAGLRHLPGLYLADIERENDILPAVSPDERIQANDLLVFVGIVESVVDLRRIRGLVPATEQVKKVEGGRRQRTLVEAVVSRHSQLIGRSVRNCQFRTRFNAAIIAVHRGGVMVDGKIGDIVLQPGDTLLMETHLGFVNAYRNSSQFYLVSQVEGAREVRHERAWLSLAILGLLVVMLALTPIDRMVSALVCAGLMVGTRCCTGTVARQSINWQVLIVIGSAIGIGRALDNTGIAQTVAEGLTRVCTPLGPHALLVAVYFMTSVVAQLVSNNGAAVLMFPIAMAVAVESKVNPVPFLMCLMSASACSFITPMAYQTNLMVYGPGGYKFTDYSLFGAPLNLAVGIVAVTLSPWFFPFHLTP